MLAVQLAYALRETAITVNSADPGFTATDLNGYRGARTVEQGLSRLFDWFFCHQTDQPKVSLNLLDVFPGEAQDEIGPARFGLNGVDFGTTRFWNPCKDIHALHPNTTPNRGDIRTARKAFLSVSFAAVTIWFSRFP